MNLNNNEQEIPEVQLEEYALNLDAKEFACRSKAKAKPQRREPAGSFPRTVPIGKRTWTDVEPGEYSISDYQVSKKLINLLRHGQHVHQEEHGAVQFWRIKENLQTYFLYSPHWSDSKWKTCMAGGGGNKKRYQYCTGYSGAIVYLRALQGQIQDAGRNLVDPSLQDNVIIQSNFFQYIYHVGCAINIHSTGRTKFGQGEGKLGNYVVALRTSPDRRWTPLRTPTSSHIVYAMDLLSIPEYVSKKGRPHGHRYGKLPGSREYYLANNLKKRCKKRSFKGIRDRFLRDHVFRERMIQYSRDK